MTDYTDAMLDQLEAEMSGAGADEARVDQRARGETGGAEGGRP